MREQLPESLQEQRDRATQMVDEKRLLNELGHGDEECDFAFIGRIGHVLEALCVSEIARNGYPGKLEPAAREIAADASKLLFEYSKSNLCRNKQDDMFHAAVLAVVADKATDASRRIHFDASSPSANNEDWGQKTWATVKETWLRLIRKKGWGDRDAVLERVAELRAQQEQFESAYLESIDPRFAKGSALELVGLYHLTKVAEILAVFITNGSYENNFQIKQLLDVHFDKIDEICEISSLPSLEPLSLLLHQAANQMIDNSIWTVTRAVNSRVTQFVRELVDKGRGDKALFEVLPPQRRALAEKGLLGSSRRAVVVSLPTSSGKTLIAQFRILQALNQFDHERGWVAYLAPTRALVNQITRRMRKDFAPLSIAVEKVSPALEIDSIEESILTQRDPAKEFRILVCTPEKLDLLLRQGYEQAIGRPLSLVVVDEAHNINSKSRGLRLELLLATINNECAHAQFLLLTPFVPNADEVARWLGDTNSDDISLAVDWQPNERAIGVSSLRKKAPLNKRSFDYCVDFETVHTSCGTIHIPQKVEFAKDDQIASTYSKAENNVGIMAAVAAQNLSARGPVIIVHSTIPHCWGLAERLKIGKNRRTVRSEGIEMVRAFVVSEYGDDFPLVSLLDYGIGIHHSGLSDEVRTLMEWLFENSELDFLVATTTIAEGMNFPVKNVVMASNQYFSKKGAEDMPVEDFWNIAGRTGRIDHDALGIVSLVAKDEERAGKLKEYVNRNASALNSALIEMVNEAGGQLSDLGRLMYSNAAWSSFLQYLAHTYRQMGKPSTFLAQIEQVLRNTFGYEKLRAENKRAAREFLSGVRTYAQQFEQPNQPLKLVDSTGFSLESIRLVLARKGEIGPSSWNAQRLFSDHDRSLQDMMGLLLAVPELRDNLKDVLGHERTDGNSLALVIKDWVNGVPFETIALRHFEKEGTDKTSAFTKCGSNLYGRLSQTVSWGLNALLSITGGELDDDDLRQARNIPSQVYYGVKTEAEVALRLLGVPRTATPNLVRYLDLSSGENLGTAREQLYALSEKDWQRAMGDRGAVYYRAWDIIEDPPNANRA